MRRLDKDIECGLNLAQGKAVEAVQKLETFLATHTEDAASDVVLLTLGELHLKQHLDGVQLKRAEAGTNSLPAMTNHLQQALADFDLVLTNFPNSTLAGKAQLDKGWALWADGKTNLSQTAFKLATEKLGHSEEQAVARFKLGETLLFQGDRTNALKSFRAVLSDFEDLPRVKEALGEQALYQIVRASLDLGDLSGATNAMKMILEWYPGGFYGDRSMLLYGQYLGSLKRPPEAREVFQELNGRFTNSLLGAEIGLAIARTYTQENDWGGAIGKYEQWLARFPTNELRPQVEFDRAWAYSRVGNATNALSQFTNFVARFPGHELAALAQYKVGLYYYEQKDFDAAENSFQHKVLLRNTNYSYQALMMAARAATARLGYGDAVGYFEALFKDTNCPPDIKAEAYFALGDIITLQPPDPGKPATAKFEEAEVAFGKIPALFPNNGLVARAWGRIGDCYYQMGSEDPKLYDKATNAYQKVLLVPGVSLLPGADVSVRSQAEFGLGQVLEKVARPPKPGREIPALLDAAFVHYTNLLYEKNLAEGEMSDPFWLKEGGLAAARLAEERGQWEMAAHIYDRLQQRLPPLRGMLEKRIERAREQQGLQSK